MWCIPNFFPSVLKPGLVILFCLVFCSDKQVCVCVFTCALVSRRDRPKVTRKLNQSLALIHRENLGIGLLGVELPFIVAIHCILVFTKPPAMLSQRIMILFALMVPSPEWHKETVLAVRTHKAISQSFWQKHHSFRHEPCGEHKPHLPKEHSSGIVMGNEKWGHFNLAD